MKQSFSVKVLLALALSAPLALPIAIAGEGVAAAQSIDLPRPSPTGKVSQMVGLTEIAVEYSSPARKGRTIFGGLLPWDQLWRTGANTATKVSFSKPVTIGTTLVPAGSYALFTIPGKAMWTVILNKNVNQGGTREYKQAEDVLRIQVAPFVIPKRERLAFLVADFTDDAANIDLEWEWTRISIPVKLATNEQAAAAIKGLGDNAWKAYNAAARYHLDSTKDLGQALALVEKSLGLKEDWWNLWTKAQILAAQGNRAEAVKLATRVQALGAKAEFFFAADDVKKALVDWQK